MIGTSGPIDAGGGRPQWARQASGISIEREGAVCEYIEIMQILPGSSDDAWLIDASRAICNMAGDEQRLLEPRVRSPDAAQHEVMRCRAGVHLFWLPIGPGSAVHRQETLHRVRDTINQVLNLELKIQKLEPLPHAEQRDRQRQRGQ